MTTRIPLPPNADLAPPNREAQAVLRTPSDDPALTRTGEEKEGVNWWGEDGFTFADVLDMVNPLQHIPVVSTIYRHITGDEMAQAPNLVGGTLFGGLMGNPLSGLASAALNGIVKENTGKELGEHVTAALTNPDAEIQEEAPQPTIIAAPNVTEETLPELGLAAAAAPSATNGFARIAGGAVGMGSEPPLIAPPRTREETLPEITLVRSSGMRSPPPGYALDAPLVEEESLPEVTVAAPRRSEAERLQDALGPRRFPGLDRPEA